MGNTIKTGMLASVIALVGALSAVAATVTVSQDTTWTSGTYDAVVVENATLTIDGTVKATGNVDIGTSNGGATVDIKSGSFEGKSFRFSVSSPDEFSGDYLNQAVIRTGAKMVTPGSFSLNGSFPSLVSFDGGSMQFYSYTQRYLFACAGTQLVLHGSTGKDISLFFSYTGGNALSLLQDWSDANEAVRLRTEGDCDVVLDSNNATVLRMRVYGYSKEKTTTGFKCVDWHHTGDLILKGRMTMMLDGDLMLPYGAQTGGVLLNHDLAVLDFNGRRAAVNSLTVTQGSVKNSADTTATLALCVAEGTKNLSDVLKATPTGAFDYEKIGAGTLVVDKTVGDKWTVTEGVLAFAATAATPADKAITISELAVNSPAMTTLVVDGVNVSCGSLTGSMRDKLLVVTKNGGTFSCASMGGGDSVLRNSTLTAADTLVKGGSGTLTIVGDDTFAASLSVQSGTVRFRAPYVTGGEKLMLRYTFKKTSGTNQKLMFEELRLSGYIEAGAASDNLFSAHGTLHADRYPIRTSVADVWQNGGMWVSGTYVESSTGTQVPLPYTPNWLFDMGNSSQRVYSPTDSIPVPGDASTWQQVVARVYWWNPGKKIYGYNFAKALFQKMTQGVPVSWTVEATTNGSDWSVIGEEADVTLADVGQWSRGWIGASDYPVVGLTPEKGLAASCVRVDKDATLDLAGLADSERTISALEIDASVGGGKITDFVPAATGEIRFVNVAGKVQTNAPILTFDRVVSPENVGNWTVFVNGKATRKGLYIANGALYLRNPGLLFVVR